MIKIKVHNGDDVQVYSFEKDTPKEDIKAALIADKHESSTLDIREEVRGEMREGVEANPIRPILDLVASKEASIHGYNQVNGPRNRDNLTEMTLAEVMKKQEDDVYMNMEGASSNAVGRYQFIPSTLEEAMRRANLSPNDLMNEENQDKMAAALLEKRGLSEFLSGGITKEQFADRLAKEWAAFPVVTGERRGQSYYKGVGNNTAHISPEEMLGFLGGLEEFGPLFVPSEGGKVTDVIASQFERLGSDTPRASNPDTASTPSKQDTKIISPSNLQSYEDSTVQKAPQSSQERADGLFSGIAVPQPTRPVKTPERFRTSSLAEEAQSLQATSAKATPSPSAMNVPMPDNPMEGMTDKMNPLLKGTPYEPGSLGFV